MFDYNIIKSKEYPQPIISIGNITVGGTGKTPHTEYLIELLKERFKIATLSRGYKRKSKGYLEVHSQSTVSDVGDEPLQMKTKYSEITVCVDEKRVHGIDTLLSYEEENRPEVILLDDAFQHRYVTPGLNILLTDYNKLITRDDILPYGRLRESANERYRAQIIIVTKCPEYIKPIEERLIIKELDIKPFQNLFFTTFKYADLQPVLNNSQSTIKDLNGQNIILFTGIANPKPLVEYLEKQGAWVNSIKFPDHYQFKTSDMLQITQVFETLSEKSPIILTTEKDLMRIKDIDDLPEVIKNNLFTIPLKVTFIGENKDYFDKKILRYVSENKSNFTISSRQNKSQD